MYELGADPRVVVIKSIPRVAQSVSKMAEGLSRIYQVPANGLLILISGEFNFVEGLSTG